VLRIGCSDPSQEGLDGPVLPHHLGQAFGAEGRQRRDTQPAVLHVVQVGQTLEGGRVLGSLLLLEGLSPQLLDVVQVPIAHLGGDPLFHVLFDGALGRQIGDLVLDGIQGLSVAVLAGRITKGGIVEDQPLYGQDPVRRPGRLHQLQDSHLPALEDQVVGTEEVGEETEQNAYPAVDVRTAR